MVEVVKEWAGTRQWSFVWCSRAHNKAAHRIASHCIDRNISCLGCIPPALESISVKDLS